MEKFIENLEISFQEKGIKTNTWKAYVTTFKRIIREVFDDKLPSNESLNTQATKDKIMEYINSTEVKPAVKITLLNGYINVLKILNIESQIFVPDFKQVSRDSANVIALQAPSEKDKANQVTMEELEKERELIKPKITDKFSTYDIRYTIMCLYTMCVPLRSQDYYNSRLYWDSSKQSNLDNHNYMCLTKKELVINDSKTSATHGSKVIKICDELIEVLKTFKRKSKSKYMVCSLTGNQFNSKSFSKFMRSIVKGKNVGSSMVRKVYVSKKLDGKITPDEQKLLAKQMGHTLSTQQQIYGRFTEKCDPEQKAKNDKIREQKMRDLLLTKCHIQLSDQILKELLAI